MIWTFSSKEITPWKRVWWSIINNNQPDEGGTVNRFSLQLTVGGGSTICLEQPFIISKSFLQFLHRRSLTGTHFWTSLITNPEGFEQLVQVLMRTLPISMWVMLCSLPGRWRTEAISRVYISHDRWFAFWHIKITLFALLPAGFITVFQLKR